MAKLQKYINYVKEAFLWPMHLITISIVGMVTAMLMIVLPMLDIIANPSALLLVLGGIEMAMLGILSSNPQFIRAINAKHSKEIQAFQKTKAITEYYNSLTAPRQRRFEHFKTKMDEIRTNYQNLHRNYPNLVNNFLRKINHLQLSYIRLLFMQDKFPSYLEKESPDDIKNQIGDLKKSMEKDSEKLKAIKMKRLGLMTKRIDAYHKASENRKIVTAQLQTIEEMIQYIQDQPMTMKRTDEEDVIIDNILFETEQMQDTISDIETIISSEYNVGDYGDMGVDNLGNVSDVVTE